MQLRFSSVRRAVLEFFRSAIFNSFFYGPPRIRLIAWSGLTLLAVIACANALVAFKLADLHRIIGNLQKPGATSDQFTELLIPCALIYLWLFVIEPKTEIIQNFFAAFWAKVQSMWFFEQWVMSFKRLTFTEAPTGVSQIIVERPLILTKDLMPLYVQLCRAMIAGPAFGYLAYAVSADLSPWLSSHLTGWLFWLVLGWSIMEFALAGWMGGKLPSVLHRSYGLYALFRTDVERSEAALKDRQPISLDARMRMRDEGGRKLDAWFSEYLRTFFPQLRLAFWKSLNQQGWQFGLVAMLPLMATTGWFSLGTVGAAVYAVNELRGALLTLPNKWPVVLEIHAQALGLQHLESILTPIKDARAPAGYFAPAE